MWTLGGITTNKASGGDGIPADFFFFFLIKKMLLLKYCTQYISKFGKLSRDHKTGKVNFLFFSFFFFLEKSISFQFQRKAMPEDVQTAKKFHSFHMLAK